MFLLILCLFFSRLLLDWLFVVLPGVSRQDWLIDRFCFPNWLSVVSFGVFSVDWFIDWLIDFFLRFLFVLRWIYFKLFYFNFLRFLRSFFRFGYFFFFRIDRPLLCLKFINWLIGWLCFRLRWFLLLMFDWLINWLIVRLCGFFTYLVSVFIFRRFGHFSSVLHSWFLSIAFPGCICGRLKRTRSSAAIWLKWAR